MPGLFGIMLKNPAGSSDELSKMIRRMADAMRSVQWLQSESWNNHLFGAGRVHLGVLNTEPQPLESPGHATRLWFDGQIYSESSSSGATLKPDQVRSLLETENGLSDLDGVFNLAAFDGSKRELVLATDRLGFRPLYFTETDQWFAYAAELKALLAILPGVPAVDVVGLRQFLAADYMLGERTWWQGIQLIPPASVWRITADGRKESRYWSFDEIKRDPQDDLEVGRELVRLWKGSVARRTRGGTMPYLLSGGLDSRLLLAELRNQGADLFALTFGTEGCSDIAIARECAALAGVAHGAAYITNENWWRGREHAIAQTDGLVNAIHLHVAAVMDQLRSGNHYTLQHSTGDTLFGGSRLYWRELTDWQSHPRELLRQFFADVPCFDKDETIELSLGDCAAYLRGPSTDCFIISQRQRRMILTGPLSMSAHCEVVNPGVGLALLRLLLGSLTDDQRGHARFYERFLAANYPRYFGNTPKASTGRGLRESFATRVARSFRHELASRLRRVPIGWRICNYFAQKIELLCETFHDYPRLLRESTLLPSILEGELHVDDCLHGDARRLLTETSSETYETARLQSAIVTAEVYLRQSVGETTCVAVQARPERDRGSCSVS